MNVIMISLFCGLTIILLINLVHTIYLNNQFKLFNCNENDNSITFDRYMRYHEIQCYLLYLAKSYPNIVYLNQNGRTFENRIISYIKISSNTTTNVKPMIMLDAGIHAREWISIPVILNLIHKLVEDPEYKIFTSNVDWLFMPLINPDGYEYSYTHDHMWRKNLAKGRYCTGVDLNRNFNISWMTKGSSSNECFEVYAGPKPFSELESKFFKYVANKFKHQLKMYISLHNYGSLVLYPYSYTKESVSNLEEHVKLATLFAKTVKTVNGRIYRIGSGANILYENSGDSKDWMKKVMQIPLSFTIELPGNNRGSFFISTKDILPIVTETVPGIIAMSNYVSRKWGDSYKAIKE